MSGITFIIGGARSGKSSLALKKASDKQGKKAYIATAQAFDDEMKARIEKHKKERSAEWDCFEEPLELARLLSGLQGKYEVLLIDCLTLWLSNIMLAEKSIEDEIDSLIVSLNGIDSSLFLVSNEVGLGIVPDNPLGRRFRDLAGTLNQRVAAAADDVYLVAAGIPVKIK
ncbi:MAG: bifunctional adenosylcobinamide kinase/adenosylcobinamide-phosphate guanylyltransferase [Nitrospirae bacterium]|nr:MAG: bifunctional adenosylcobinamide kinase/adenosylcobinamide-phosphate guanylyltransferase [Nitrospirota bacterium]